MHYAAWQNQHEKILSKNPIASHLADLAQVVEVFMLESELWMGRLV